MGFQSMCLRVYDRSIFIFYLIIDSNYWEIIQDWFIHISWAFILHIHGAFMIVE